MATDIRLRVGGVTVGGMGNLAPETLRRGEMRIVTDEPAFLRSTAEKMLADAKRIEASHGWAEIFLELGDWT